MTMAVADNITNMGVFLLEGGERQACSGCYATLSWGSTVLWYFRLPLFCFSEEVALGKIAALMRILPGIVIAIRA